MSQGIRSSAGAVTKKAAPVSCQTNSGGGGGGTSPGYLDYNANVSIQARIIDIKSEKTCDRPGFQWYIPGECENGHRFAKELVCGKEWCARCGAEGSVAHNRKFARWLPKLQQMESAGYFIFTIPESARSQYLTKAALTTLGHQVQELLKASGFLRGLRRWHWFGDKSIKFHPHLNVLVDGGFISPEQLACIKADYAHLLGVELADVRYRYRRSPGRMVHTLKYVARATFRDWRWSPGLAVELRGFRNMVAWGRGRWNDEPSWSLVDLGGVARVATEGLDIKAIKSLFEGVCPVCGLPLTWGKPRPIGLLLGAEKTPLGAGYYRFTDSPRSPPGDWYHLLYPRLGYLQNLKHYKLELAADRAGQELAAEADYKAALWRAEVN